MAAPIPIAIATEIVASIVRVRTTGSHSTKTTTGNTMDDKTNDANNKFIKHRRIQRSSFADNLRNPVDVLQRSSIFANILEKESPRFGLSSSCDMGHCSESWRGSVVKCINDGFTNDRTSR